MTAVDQAGNRVTRYRLIEKPAGWDTAPRKTEIIVHPGWELTDELALALTVAISSEWLGYYFGHRG
jgi:hypothetical protein